MMESIQKGLSCACKNCRQLSVVRTSPTRSYPFQLSPVNPSETSLSKIKLGHAWMISGALKPPARNQQIKSTVWLLEEQSTEGGAPFISGKSFWYTVDGHRPLFTLFNIQVSEHDISISENQNGLELEGAYLNKAYKNSSTQSVLCKERKTYAPSR